MVLFFITLLALSIFGMVAMLAVKRYELTSGKMVFSGVRPAVSSVLATVVVWIEKVLPALVRQELSHWGHKVRAMAQRGIAQSILAFEYWLEKTLHIVREKTAPTREPGEASAFLREVADHKKQLLTRADHSIEE